MSWPNPQRPGEPAGSDPWHWVSRTEDAGAHAQPISWNPALRRWTGWDGAALSAEEAGRRFTYLGPALSPAEVSARVSSAIAAATPAEPAAPRGLAALAASAPPEPPPAMVYRAAAIRNHLLIFAGTLFGTLFVVEKFGLMQ